MFFFSRGLLRRDLVFFRTKAEGRSSCFKALESCNGLENHTGWNKHRTLLKGKCQACSCCCFKCLFFCWGPLASLSGVCTLSKGRGAYFFLERRTQILVRDSPSSFQLAPFGTVEQGVLRSLYTHCIVLLNRQHKQPNHV